MKRMINLGKIFLKLSRKELLVAMAMVKLVKLTQIAEQRQ